MNRLDRLQAILLQLQSKKVVTAQEIANRFEISIRTVYRDIRALEEAGVPIGAEAGIGYFLDDNYNLPPVMFTNEEASALLIAGKFMPHMADKEVENNFQLALHKVRAVMKTEQKEALDKLDNSVKVYSGITEPPTQDSIYLQDVQKALIEQKVVQIEYFSFYKQELLTRMIEPVGLLHYAGNWHLISFCRLRNQYRDFRLDRIQKFSITDITYNRQLDKAFNEYLLAEKEKVNLHEIVLRFNEKPSIFIQQSKYWYGFIKETEKQNIIEMEFLNPDLEGFSRWIVSLGKGVRVISPADLKEKVLVLVKDLYEENF